MEVSWTSVDSNYVDGDGNEPQDELSSSFFRQYMGKGRVVQVISKQFKPTMKYSVDSILDKFEVANLHIRDHIL